MKNGAAILLLTAALLWSVAPVSAQQRPQMTHYLFQQLAYNPAYAGSKGYLQSGLSLRSQWMGIEGAPRNLYLNVHSPLRNERVALGLQAQSDRIGPTRSTQVHLTYAYRIRLDKIRISAGMQAGMETFRVDWRELNLQDPQDDAFPATATTWTSPVVGIGFMADGDHWYAGISVPSLLEQDLFYESANARFTQRLRHAYAMGGGEWSLSEDWRLLTAGLLSAVWGTETAAPFSADFYLSAFYQELFLLGLSWQTGFPAGAEHQGLARSGGLFSVLQLDNGLRFGLSFDLPFSRLAQPAAGSLEWTVGYEWKVKARRVATPRFFW